MSNRDIFPVRHRRRRRNMTVAGLIVTALSALLYQYNGKPDSNSSRSAAPQSQPRTASRPPRDRSSNSTADAARSTPGQFDFYLLALSMAPAFCEDGHQQKRQCQSLNAQSFAATPLTLHGLWPENEQPESYPRDCSGERLNLSAATRSAMTRWMPGAADGLDKHEWSKHGTCTGLSGDEYFLSAMRLVEQVNGALGPAIRGAEGRSVTAAGLRASANAAQPGMGESLVFVCKNMRGASESQRRKPFLMEVRACVDNDGPGGAPRRLMKCATVQRRDQGCGSGFQIDGP
jgi:ribonuclease T2